MVTCPTPRIFRHLQGHIPQTDEGKESDFALAFEDCTQRQMFVTCRAKANALVDADFRRLAHAYYRTRNKNYAYGAIKLAKLRSLFTFYYYIRAVEQSRGEGNVQKDSYSILPKVAVNDLIRNGLSDRDREVLVLVTGNKGK